MPLSTRYPTAFATDAAAGYQTIFAAKVGNNGATVLKGPVLNTWDLGIEKTFAISREATKLQLRAEMFNAWSHAQFQEPNGDAGAGVNFGRISATLLIQIAMKLQL